MHKKILLTLIFSFFSISAFSMDPFVGVRASTGPDIAINAGAFTRNWRFYGEVSFPEFNSYALLAGADYLFPVFKNFSFFTGANAGILSDASALNLEAGFLLNVSSFVLDLSARYNVLDIGSNGLGDVRFGFGIMRRL